LIDLRCGDALDVLRTLPADSVDAVVTDPPAGINFMNMKFDSDRGGRDKWVAWLGERLAEAFRVAKPGAVMLCWALPRTSHWTALAIEAGGWQIEDRIAHLFAQGFPKHKSKLKPACEDWWLARKPGPKWLGVDHARIDASGGRPLIIPNHCPGFGDVGVSGGSRAAGTTTAGRYPPNVAISHHSDCREVGTRRVKTNSHSKGANRPYAKPSVNCYGDVGLIAGPCHVDPDGCETVTAWECHPECAVRMLDEMAGERKSGGKAGAVYGREQSPVNCYGDGLKWGTSPALADSGGASRFFFCAKASRRDRESGLEGMPERVKLRDDLTPEQRAFVLSEMQAAGVAT
jgi:hypothetical protein